MVPALLLGTALFAPASPVPLDTVPAPTGPAPQVAYLKPDANGELWINGVTYQRRKFTSSQVVVENGKQVVKQVEREQTVPLHFRRQLADSDAKFSTAGGAELSAAAATRRIGDGAAVLVSADGKAVEKGWLLGIHPDTVVIASEALAGAVVMPPSPAMPSTSAPRMVLLATDAKGKVTVAYNPGGANGDPSQERFVGRGVIVVNGQVVQRSSFNTHTSSGPSGEFPTQPLDEMKFEAYTLEGQPVARDEALRRLKAGGLVVIASDARLPDADYLKLFRGDLLVLVSPELALPASANAKIGVGVRRPLPVNAVPPAPVPGAVPVPVQIRPAVAPAGNQRLVPAAPAPAPVPRAVPIPRAAPVQKAAPAPQVEKPAKPEK